VRITVHVVGFIKIIGRKYPSYPCQKDATGYTKFPGILTPENTSYIFGNKVETKYLGISKLKY
jgi:hypothetical protein